LPSSTPQVIAPTAPRNDRPDNTAKPPTSIDPGFSAKPKMIQAHQASPRGVDAAARIDPFSSRFNGASLRQSGSKAVAQKQSKILPP